MNMWYEKSKRRIIMDLHFPEWDRQILRNYDVKQMMDNLERASVDSVILYAKCHNGNSYYNTRVGHKHKCLGKKDMFGECVRQARKRNIWPVAYYSIVWDKYIAKTHPDWVMIDNEGKPVDSKLSWAMVCYNSDGYKDYCIAQLKEIATGYDVEGFWLDMLCYDTLQLSCYCHNCRRLFKEKTGLRIPPSPTWDRAWKKYLEFRYETTEKFGRDIVREIKSVAPQKSVIFNYHGYPGLSWKTGHRPIQHTLFNDYATGEVMQQKASVYASLGCRFLQGLVQGRPFETLSVRFTNAQDYTVKPLEQLRWEVMTTLSNGGSFVFIDQPFYTGKVCEVTYDRIGKVYGEARKKRKLFGGIPIKQVGLYYSVKTRDFYAREHLSDYLLAFQGAYKALFECHIPTDILLDENITLGRLRAYPLLFLANTAILDEKEEAVITEYVKEGGSLIATHDTSLYDLDGQIRNDFTLRELFNAEFRGKTETKYNYVRISEGGFNQGIDPRYYILSLGPGNIVKSSGKMIGGLHISFYDRRPGKFFSHHLHPPYRKTGPAVVINQYGKGKVVYLPFRPDATYISAFGIPEHRFLIRNLVKMLSGDPLICVDAPLNVEVVVNEQVPGKRYVVHFIASNLTLPIETPETEMIKKIRPYLMSEEPRPYRAKIKTKSGYLKAYAFNKNTQLTKKGNIIEMTINATHEAVSIER